MLAPILNSVAASGVLASLKPADSKVFLAILGHAGERTLRAWCGMRRIAEQTGLKLGTVSTAVSRLVKLGLLTVEDKDGNPMSGGDGRRYVYRVTVPSPPNGQAESPFSARRTERSAATERFENSTVRGGEFPPFGDGEPAVRRPSNETVERNDQQQQKGMSVAGREITSPPREDAPDSDAVVRELKKYGVAEPKRSAVARSVPGLHVSDVRQLWQKARQGQNPPGLLVRLIEANGAELVHRRQSRAVRPTIPSASPESGLSDMSEEAKIRLWVRQLCDDERKRLKQLVLDATGGPTATRWQSVDPREHAGLARRMWIKADYPPPEVMGKPVA